MAQLLNKLLRSPLIIPVVGILAVIYSCNSSSAESSNMAAPPPPQLPVIEVTTSPATTFQEFPASLEGKVNVEIRPQVDGYLQKFL